MSAPMAISIAPVDLVLRVARGRRGGSEVPANSNKGPFVEPILKSVNLEPGNPWCAAYVYDTGTIALPGLWPGPRTGSCEVLAEYFRIHGVLVSGPPQRGDIFLLWEFVKGEQKWRFAHTGFITLVNADGSCVTNEGNTNGAGSREGWLAAEKVRTFGDKDRFGRWANLLRDS